MSVAVVLKLMRGAFMPWSVNTLQVDLDDIRLSMKSYLGRSLPPGCQQQKSLLVSLAVTANARMV
jgi:hypothetical protein